MSKKKPQTIPKFTKQYQSKVIGEHIESKWKLGASNPNWGFPGDTVVKNLHTNERDIREESFISGSGRSPGVGNGNPLQYCMKNSMDRGAW